MRQPGAIALRVVLFPFSLVRAIGHLFIRVFGRLLRPLLRRVDRSPWLSRQISLLSSSMATQRGLLVLIGTFLVTISLALHAVIVVGLVASDAFGRALYWLCLPFALFHVGVLVGFIGIMLAVPLGQGYRSQRE